ncbi:DUF397 domain-containing protein [Streptomyces sp. S-2]|nr:DUF397 domain-containing protein [Streptomyces sp. S-2]
MFDPEWTKSSYSSQDGGDCVEWAPSVALATGTVPVRDGKAPRPAPPRRQLGRMAGLCERCRSRRLTRSATGPPHKAAVSGAA